MPKPVSKKDPIAHLSETLHDGRRVVFFLNRDTGLIVVDIVNKNEKEGVEILRTYAGSYSFK